MNNKSLYDYKELFTLNFQKECNFKFSVDKRDKENSKTATLRWSFKIDAREQCYNGKVSRIRHALRRCTHQGEIIIISPLYVLFIREKMRGHHFPFSPCPSCCKLKHLRT